MADPSPRPDPQDQPADEAPDDTAEPSPSGSWWPLLPVAVLTYVPFLLTRPGLVSADTKSYLYLDPGRLLGRAWSMWDPNVGLGTVSHQTIGYLWPMGPWFWFFETLGVPDWVAQRLWWGTLLFTATAGAAYLLRRFELPAVAVWPAALVYGLSPYSVAYLGRLSGVLLPAVGLPWLLAFTIQAVRSRGWRYPALFALTVTTVGSVNLTALALVGLAPVTWLLFVLVTRQAPWRAVAGATARIAVLTLATSAWWLAGLSVQASHGIDIVRYSESAEVVSRTALALEVMRGLGYWFFYGGDKLQLWIEPSFQYMKRRLVFLGTFFLPTLALVSGAISRWRHRAYFVGLLVLGVFVSVGAHPWTDPSPLGRAMRWFFGTERGLAFRSVPRAVPLIAVAAAALIAGLLAGQAVRRPRVAGIGAVVVVLASVFGMVPLWNRSIVQDSLARQDVPEYWMDAAALLDERDDGTRVLEVPGSDFASYRWGNTVDPITPGLIDRPYVARELVPSGTPPSADLLNSLDLLLQERTLDPQAIAPLARLMRVGDIVVRGDLQYERYNLARPRLVWDLLRDAPGLGEPIVVTTPYANESNSRIEMHDETWLLQELQLEDGPAVAIVPVEDARPIVDVKSAQGAVVLSGDGAGIVDAASAGRIDGSELIRYSASLDVDAVLEELDRGAGLVVTDTNRKRGERWGSLRHTRGETERVDQPVLAENLTDNRLPRFPDRGSDVQTVTIQRGGIEASATSYGNPITFAGDNRAALAVDGDPDTAWATAAFSDARGERLELDLDEPLELDHLLLQQLDEVQSPRLVTRVRIDLHDGDPVVVALTPASRTRPGQRVDLGERRTDRVTITILDDTMGGAERFGNAGPVGFAEVTLGVDPPRLEEIVRVPTDLVDAVSGTEEADTARLTYLFTRLRQDPTDRTRDDEERAMQRLFGVPADRTFALAGTARISARAPDAVLDELFGTTGGGTVSVESSDRTSGTRAGRASAALDGDPSTAWTTPFVRADDQWITVRTAEPQTFERLDLQVVADLAHSVPTRLRIAVDGRTVAEPELPPVERAELGHVVTVPLDIPRTVGSRLTVEVVAIDPIASVGWTADGPIDHPVAIAELGIPGLQVDEAPETLDTGCRADLVAIDGAAVPVRISGPSGAAEAGEALDVRPCGEAALDLGPGDHELHVLPGVDTGIDLDQLVLESAGDTADATAPTTSARATVQDADPDHLSVELTGLEPGVPVWLVLGQSYSDGWVATGTGTGDLGTTQLVDGFANGWLVVPDGTTATVDLRFTPQRRVDVALGLSALGIVVALVLAVRRPRGGRAPDLADGTIPMDAGRPLDALPAVGLGVVVALAVAVVGSPPAALGLGAAAAVAARWSIGRRVLRWLPAGLFVVAVAVAFVLEVRGDFPPGIEWATHLDPSHPVAVAAVAALAVDQVVDRLWRRRST